MTNSTENSKQMPFDPTKPFYAVDKNDPEDTPRPARIICDDMRSKNTTYVALVQSRNFSDREDLWFVGLDGEKSAGVNPFGNFLVNIPEEHEVIITCVRRLGDKKIDYMVGKPNDQWEAIASKRITFKEGEFEE